MSTALGKVRRSEPAAGITLSAVCSSSLRELISCFRYWISDSLTRSRTWRDRSRVITPLRTPHSPPDPHPLHLGATEPGHKAQNGEKGGLGSQDLPVPLCPQCTVPAVWKDRGSWWPKGSHPRGRAHLQLVGVLALGERRASSLSSTLPGQQGPQPRDLRSQAVIQLLEDGGRCYGMGEQGQGSAQSQQHLPALLGASSVAFWSCKRASLPKTLHFHSKER